MDRKETIEKLKTKIFLIEMIDRWTKNDRKEYHKACDELRALKEEEGEE